MSVIVVTQSGSPANVLTPTESAVTATSTNAGIVKQMTFTAKLTAAPTQADFNALLTKLIAAGLMASS